MPIICSHFLHGSCRYGPQCRRSHDIGNATQDPSTPAAVVSPSVHIQLPNQPSYRALCNFFLEGRCTKGAACSFGHPGPSPQSNQPSWLTPTRDTLITSQRSLNTSSIPGIPFLHEPCKYFLQGGCKNGSLCPFRHPDITNIVECPLPSQDSGTDVPPKIACRYYHQGRCMRGETCTFLHVKDTKANQIQPIAAIKPHMPIGTLLDDKSLKLRLSPASTPNHAAEHQGDVLNPTPSLTTSTRLMLYCEVHFGAGASVMHITTPFESCLVVLSNLPKSLAQADMLELTRPLDGLVKFTVFEATSTATLYFTNCDQACKAVHYLDNRSYAQTKLAARLNLRGTVESGSGTLLSRRVKLSWFAPSVMAWANYSDEGRAHKMADKVNTKTFDGRSLSASLNSHMNPISRHRRYTWSSSTTVKIKGLPLDTDQMHLKRFVQCDTLSISQPTYNQDKGIAELRKLLSQNGPLESFDVLPVDKNKSKLTAFAQFSNSDAAAKVAKEVNNTKHEFLGNSTIWVEQIHSVKYSIPWKQFMMVKNELDDLQGKHHIPKLRYYEQQQAVCIRAYGPDPKSLGRLKVDVEHILRGQLFSLNGENVWDEYFETEQAAQYINTLNNSQPTVFVKCDTRTRSLCLYGDRDLAERRIKQRLEQVAARRHVLSLEKDHIRGLLRGGSEDADR